MRVLRGIPAARLQGREYRYVQNPATCRTFGGAVHFYVAHPILPDTVSLSAAIL